MKIVYETGNTKVTIELGKSSLIYVKTQALGGMRNIPIQDIDCVLLSIDNKLSIQCGKKIYTIPIDQNNDDHLEFIKRLNNKLKPRPITGKGK